MKNTVELLEALIKGDVRDGAEMYNRAAGTSASAEEAFETLRAIEALNNASRPLLEATRDYILKRKEQ